MSVSSLRALVENHDVLVDDDILEEHGHRYASIDTNGYISIGFSRKTPPRRRRLHRVVVPGHEVVHHVNNNKRDNRRSNLVGTTQSYNLLVKRLATDDTSRGTRLHKKSGRWQARICIDKKEKSLGYFDTQEEARSAYLAGYATLVADRLGGNERQ